MAESHSEVDCFFLHARSGCIRWEPVCCRSYFGTCCLNSSEIASTTHRLPTNTTGPKVREKTIHFRMRFTAIGQHLFHNDHCAASYNEDQSSILDTARSRFHDTSLEASYIRVRRPNRDANRKSLFTLSICSRRLQVVATCPIKSDVTISHLIG